MAATEGRPTELPTFVTSTRWRFAGSGPLQFVAFLALIVWTERVEPRMDFGNSTDLDSDRLRRLLLHHTWPYSHDELTVRVRYSRGADFSGTCYYGSGHIYVNLGRDNVYPYLLAAHIARSQSNRTHWWRETYQLVITDAYQMVLFVYRHELFHYLVKVAGRNTRRKESMCDRFATRALVDDFGVRVVDARGGPVERASWDFQDVDKFVDAAPRVRSLLDGLGPREPRPIPVRIWGLRTGTRRPVDKPSPNPRTEPGQ